MQHFQDLDIAWSSRNMKNHLCRQIYVAVIKKEPIFMQPLAPDLQRFQDIIPSYKILFNRYLSNLRPTSKSVPDWVPLLGRLTQKSADPCHNEFRHSIGYFKIWLIYWLDILVWHFASTTFSGFQRILSTSKGHRSVSTFTPFIQRFRRPQPFQRNIFKYHRLYSNLFFHKNLWLAPET